MTHTRFTLLRSAAFALALSLIPLAAGAAEAPAGAPAKPAKESPAPKAKKTKKAKAAKADDRTSTQRDAAKIPESKVDKEMNDLEKNMRGNRGKGKTRFDPAAKQPVHGDGTTPDTPKERP